MPHPVDIHVGLRLKQLRKARKLSQTDLGEQLDLSFQQIQKYEAGSNRISASRLFELGQVLNVELTYFFDGIDNEKSAVEETTSTRAVATAFAAIENNDTKKRILSFIEDISSAKF